MVKSLSDEYIRALKEIDTPTICNAIEQFQVRGRVEGFMGMDIRCLSPDLGAMVGCAVTVTVDSTTPESHQEAQTWLDWLRVMDASPKPVVLVFKDIGPLPRKSAHFGEVMGTVSKRLGVTGLVTDGGVRDILEVRRLGIHYFAPGLVPSHGNPRLIQVNVPVVIDGVRIEPGDLIHGDINGVTVIPWSIADRVVEAAMQVRAREAETMSYINSVGFTVDEYYQRRYGH
jgi:regulator of RNase E activity RraA